jgi:hypothetical protein
MDGGGKIGGSKLIGCSKIDPQPKPKGCEKKKGVKPHWLILRVASWVHTRAGGGVLK